MRNSSRNTFAIVLLGASLLNGSARSSDEWGYDHVPTPAVGLSAGPARSMALPAAKGTERLKAKQPVDGSKTANSAIQYSNSRSQAAPARSTSKKSKDASGRLQARALPPQLPATDKIGRAIQFWGQLYEFAGGSALTADQKTRLNESLRAKLDSSEADKKVTGILEFWPRVESATAASQDQKENYKALLRALLRLESQRLAATDSKQAELISEVLGPARVAAPGTPPLTEDAIEAYADMACFLYEEGHPGKTVNAIDNRMVFASVIRSKFIEAPTQKDRDVMANFDLSWSKFKILWSGADENGRKRLLAAWTLKDDATTSGTTPKDPTLDSVMHKGPWAN